MRAALVAAILLLAPVGAEANEPTIVDACARAAALQLNVAEVQPADVQAFPELSPPRVRFTAMVAKGSADLSEALDDMFELRSAEGDYRDFGWVECEFATSTAPFGLLSFLCQDNRCNELVWDDKRLEELKALLAREGQ
jgi:hypothetical protein